MEDEMIDSKLTEHCFKCCGTFTIWRRKIISSLGSFMIGVCKGCYVRQSHETPFVYNTQRLGTQLPIPLYCLFPGESHHWALAKDRIV
jgi:hypothetical protein